MLVLFFLLAFILENTTALKFHFKAMDYVHSFGLVTVGMPGIGFMWIMGIFFVISIFMPLIYIPVSRLNRNIFSAILCILFLLWEVFCYIMNLKGVKFSGITAFAIYSLGYLLCSSFGLWMAVNHISSRNKLMLGLFFIVIYVFFLFINDFAPTQTAKYPPRLYYLSYALGVSLIFMYSIESFRYFIKISELTVVSCISRYSLDLYLCHIIPIKIFNLMPFWSSISWVLRYIIVISIAIIFTFVWNYIKKIKSEYNNII